MPMSSIYPCPLGIDYSIQFFFYSETFLLRYKIQYREINDAEDLQGLARSNRTNGRSLLQSFTAPTVRSD